MLPEFFRISVECVEISGMYITIHITFTMGQALV